MEPVALGGFPFDSQITGYQPDGLPIYDRASNSEEFASLIKSFWRDGVFGTDALTVLAGSGMTATVGTGSVLVQGRVARIASPKTVSFETANSQPRFDIVVARRDLSNAVRDVVLDVVKGVPASTPVAPSPVRNATIWELCLAIVKIPANVGMVQQQNITDTRLDKNLCGIVAATMTDIDTSRFYEQIQADLTSFQEEEKAQFDAWFDSLRDILDENVAGNLYDKIESLTASDVGALATADILDTLYPVGIIVPFSNTVEPAAVWGGTWELLEEGRTVIQSGSTYVLGSTGGEASHTLTVDEMPKHRHIGKIGYQSNGYGYNTSEMETYLKSITTPLENTRDNPLVDIHVTNIAPTTDTGGSQPHNNLPPYLAVNIWQRTA